MEERERARNNLVFAPFRLEKDREREREAVRLVEVNFVMAREGQ